MDSEGSEKYTGLYEYCCYREKRKVTDSILVHSDSSISSDDEFGFDDDEVQCR